MSDEKKANVPFRQLRELLAGGLCNATASAFMNPMDVVKVRLQTQAQLGNKVSEKKLYQGFTHCLRRIVSEEGFFARWGGLWFPGFTASMMREFGYSSFRFGCYQPIKEFFGADKGDIGLTLKIAAGLTTGGLGSALATPTDVVKLRFQREAGKMGSDGKYETGLHKGKAPLYRNTFNAFATIYREDGIRGLYKGVGPTMLRAAFLAAGQLASYDHTKFTLKQHNLMQEGTPLHIFASLVSALCAATACQPFDTVKARYMTDKASGTKLYQSGLDCAIKTLKYDGLTGLYRGWLPSYLRLGPHFILALPLWEQCRRLLGLGYLK